MNSMAQISILDYLKEMEKGIHAQLQAQADMTDKVILPKLDSIESQAKLTNGRVNRLEVDLSEQVSTCKFVQNQKQADKDLRKERSINTRFVISLLVTIILGLIGYIYIQ